MVLYAAHLLYGALITDAAMAMNIAAALLLGACLISSNLRSELARHRGLVAPAACFALVITAAVLSLTSWTPGGPHPVWAFMGLGPGASTIDRSATVVEIVKLLGLACMFGIGSVVGARDDRGRFAVQLTILLGVFFAIWALILALTSPDQVSGRRLQAHFTNPNTAGTVFAVLLSLALAEGLRFWRGDTRTRFSVASALHAFAALVFAASLIFTGSRGATVAFVAGSCVYVGLQMSAGRLRPSRALVTWLAVMLAMIVLVIAVGDQLADRLFQSRTASIGRSEIWSIHWRAFIDSPLFGYGLGTAETVNKTLITPQNWPELWSIRAILNVYLQWLEEGGLVTAAPMFFCVGLLILQTLLSSGRRSRMRGLLAGLLATDAVFIVHGATDFGLEVPSVAALWAWLLGLQFSLAQGTSSK